MLLMSPLLSVACTHMHTCELLDMVYKTWEVKILGYDAALTGKQLRHFTGACCL
jgi:hypothetical protein